MKIRTVFEVVMTGRKFFAEYGEVTQDEFDASLAQLKEYIASLNYIAIGEGVDSIILMGDFIRSNCIVYFQDEVNA
jgi:hypothetical protein